MYKTGTNADYPGFHVHIQALWICAPDTLYETTHSWNSEPQNIEYRTAECRRMESLCSVFFKIDRIHYFEIRHSTFIIRYSLFQSFFYDQTGCFSGQAVHVWYYISMSQNQRCSNRSRRRPRSVWHRASRTLFFDYENEDDDEKQSTGHFRHLPLMSLHSSLVPNLLKSHHVCTWFMP